MRLLVFVITGLISASTISTWAQVLTNNIPVNVPGYLELDMLSGGGISAGYITGLDASNTLIQREEVIFDYSTYITIDDGTPFVLANTATNTVQLIGANAARSSGRFLNTQNDVIEWFATTSLPPGANRAVTTYEFTALTGTLGLIELSQYLDEDVISLSENVLFTRGSILNGTFELFTVHDPTLFGLGHGGRFNTAQGLVNATYLGWAADRYSSLEFDISSNASNLFYSVAGNVETNSLPPFVHPVLGPVWGPNDITSSLAWVTNPNATRSVIITTFGGLPDAEATLPDLYVDKSSDRTDAINGDESVTYTLEYGNNGIEATGITIVDTFPIGVFSSVVAPSGVVNLVSGTITYMLPVLQANETNSFTATATLMSDFDLFPTVPNGVSSLINTIEIFDDGLNGVDFNSSNNISSVTNFLSIDCSPKISGIPDDIMEGCIPGEITDLYPVLLDLDNAVSVTGATQVTISLASNLFDGCERLQVYEFLAANPCAITVERLFVRWIGDAEPADITNLSPAFFDQTINCLDNIPDPDPFLFSSNLMDSCSAVSSTVVVVDVPAEQAIDHVYTFSDDCSNTGVYTQRFTYLSSQTPAVFTDCPDPVLLGCDVALPSDADILATASAVGGMPFIGAVQTNVTDCTLEVIYTLLVSNFCGAESCEAVYQVTDSVLATPQFNCPGPTDLGCNPLVIPLAGDVLNSVSGCDVQSSSVSEQQVTNGCEVTLTRTFTATGPCGSIGECIQVLNWRIDTDGPVFGVPTQVDVGCNPSSIPSPDETINSVTDACADGSASLLTETIVTNGCVTVMTREFQALDDCGNRSTFTQELSWRDDQEPPMLSGCPSVPIIFVEPGQPIVIAVVTAIDDCVAIVTVDQVPVSTNSTGDVDTRVTWTASDCANSEVSCSVLYTYDATSIPPLIIDCAGDVDLGCNPDLSTLPSTRDVFASLGLPCGIVTSTVEISTTGDNCHSVIERTYTILDLCGRTSSCTERFSFTTDRDAPQLVLPANVNQCGTDATPAATGMASASDTCGDVTITFNDSESQVDCQRVIDRVWVAMDVCGNVTQSVQRIELVVDTASPVFNCSGEFNMTPNEFGFYELPDVTAAANVTDDCNFTLTQSPAPGGLTFDGAMVTVTATDDCGNIDTCTLILRTIAGSAAIGDVVWEDLNGDGVRDADEPGLGELTVNLLDANGAIAATTQTDSSGAYVLSVDTPGTYQVAVVAPGFTGTTAGSDSALGQDSNQTAAFAIGSGDVNLGVDLGLVRSTSINGYVWQDLNNNNDPSDENLAVLGVNGVVMTLCQASASRGVTDIATTTTATGPDGSQGYYNFNNLAPGEYVVKADLDLLPVSSQGQTIASGQSVALNFGFVPDPTAVVLESLTADAGMVQWQSATELETLGYNVIDLATGETVNDRLILAHGPGEYSIELGPGRYALEELTSALERVQLGEIDVYPEVDATPSGGENLVLAANEDGTFAFETTTALDVLVTGVRDDAITLDLTDPEQAVRLRHPVLETESGNAAYFHAPGSAKIEIK